MKDSKHCPDVPERGTKPTRPITTWVGDGDADFLQKCSFDAVVIETVTVGTDNMKRSLSFIHLNASRTPKNENKSLNAASFSLFLGFQFVGCMSTSLCRLHKQTGGVTPQSCHFSTQQLQPQQQQ